MTDTTPAGEMDPTTIDDVVARLDAIIDESRATGSRLGYFAALYRRVTIAVKAGIENGDFDDGPRMERFDVVFAGRYLDALREYQNGGSPSTAWKVAFDAADSWRPIVLQHLLLGMNAHIGLDLGIAAARTCPGPALASLEGDFNRINTILGSLIDTVEDELAEIWPAIALLDRLAGKTEESLIRFSMDVARDQAWRLAETLAPLPPEEQAPHIAEVDQTVTGLGRLILFPGVLISTVALVIRLTEWGTVRSRIDSLAR